MSPGSKATDRPWLEGNDEPAPPACIACLEAQVAARRHPCAEEVRRLRAVLGAAQRRELARLVAAYALGVEAVHALLRSLRVRSGVAPSASIGFGGAR